MQTETDREVEIYTGPKARTVEVMVGSRPISFETGRVAKQADGSVIVTCGETKVLVTAVGAKEPKGKVFFLPLTVEFREFQAAAGKIPGGFFRREGRPATEATLSARMIDRPIRPLFPKGYNHEIQVITFVLSYDQVNTADILGINGTSLALSMSHIPWDGPIGAVRIGYLDGELIANPTEAEIEEGSLNLVVAGKKDGILMVEAGVSELDESIVLDALALAQQEIIKIINAQEEIIRQVAKPKVEFVSEEVPEEIVSQVKNLCQGKLTTAITVKEKMAREAALKELKTAIVEELCPTEETEENIPLVKSCFENLMKKEARRLILVEGRRADGRSANKVRPIWVTTSELPRAHGSAIFTRGETQALATVTLGTSRDEQIIDGLKDEYRKRFMLHYNFPPFSVGEARFLRGPGRREIGHGVLAERALTPILPDKEDFPYTIRIVSDILESNGSSSMASVCGGCLALMDAGVPIKAPVAGIAMGLIKEGDQHAIITDIIGFEDHLGDMDFKVTGTRQGITALQMDNKVGALPREILVEALNQAKDARIHILDIMKAAMPTHRDDLSEYAPRITVLQIAQDQIGTVIGPGGRMIRKIIEETGVDIEIEDDGSVFIVSTDAQSSLAAQEMVKLLTAEVKVGGTYFGRITRLMNFGAFAEILPGREGLIHISQLANDRTNRVSDVVEVGDEVIVKVVEIDDQKRINLSRKAALNDKAAGKKVDIIGGTNSTKLFKK